MHLLRDPLPGTDGRALIRVIGLGNELRGDDAIGLEIARRLRREPGLEVLEHRGEALDLLGLWEPSETVALIDAMRSGEPVGTLHRYDAGDVAMPRPPLLRAAGHSVTVSDAIELGRGLRRLPERLIVFGIEGECFDLGAGLSPAARAVLEPLSRLIAGELRGLAV